MNDAYKWLLFMSIWLLFVQFVILVKLIGSIYSTAATVTKTMLSNNVLVMVALFVSVINMTMLFTASGSLIFFSTDG